MNRIGSGAAAFGPTSTLNMAAIASSSTRRLASLAKTPSLERSFGTAVIGRACQAARVSQPVLPHPAAAARCAASGPRRQQARGMAKAAKPVPKFPRPPADAAPPLDGYRILDMTRVLAGGHLYQVTRLTP